MVMRTDIATSFPQRRNMETPMAKKSAPSRPHHETVGDAARLGMQHLNNTGVQSVTVPAIEFAELQDQGPTARAPRPYNGSRKR